MVRFTWYRVNRNSFALGCLPLFLILGSAFSTENRIVIEVGTLSAEDGDGWMLSQIRSFEESHPDVDVRHFAVGFPSRDDLRIEDLPELALNVIGVRSDMGYEIGYLVENDLIVPIESFLPDSNFDFEDFFPNVWDYVTMKDRHWGVPYLCSSVVLIADWDVFARAGVREQPETWEDFMRVLPLLTQDTDRDGAVDQWGFRLGMRGRHDTHLFYLWLTKVLQDGGYVMREGRFDLTHPSLRKAYEFMDRLQKSPYAREDNRRFKTTAGDLTYRYGMQIAPSYFLNPLMKQHNYRIIPWVTSGDKVIQDERRHYLCVCKSTPEKEKASWDFLKWVSRAEAEHPDGAWTFHLSARKDLLERKDIQHKIESWSNGFDVMHETKGWNVQPGDQILGRFEAMERLEEIVTDLFHGNIAFEEAMDHAEGECNAILADFQNPAAPNGHSSDLAVLLEMANSYWDGRDFEQASTEYLRIWKTSPEVVKEERLRFRIVASLRNAGYYLQAETLANCHRPGFVAGAILEEIESGIRLTAENIEEIPNTNPPNLLGTRESSEVSQLIQDARIACASAFHGWPSLDSFSRFNEECEALLKSETKEALGLERLAIYHCGVADLTLRLQSHGDGSRSLLGDYNLEASPVKDLARRIASVSLDLACEAAANATRTGPLVFNALDMRIGIGMKLGEVDDVVASYRKVLNQFPEAEDAPKYFLDLAVLLRETVGDLEEAVAICRGLGDRFGESKISNEARLKGALWLYQARRYREAKADLEGLKQGVGRNRNIAWVLCALCDYALGEKVNAEKAIQQFIDEHPNDDLAQRARLWLLSNRVADFQFFEAKEMVQRLKAVNPNSPALPEVLSIEKRLFDPPY